MPSKPFINLHRLFLGIAFLLLGFLLIVYFVYAINLFNFPFDYDQGEGFELVDTILFSQGQFPYQDTETYPFYSSNYPPMFHIIAVPFVWVFGNAYWYGRLLSFVGTLITASLIAYAVYRDGRQIRSIAILSGLAFLASNFIYHIGPLVRQHMTMVMFETVAVVILVRAFPQKDKRNITIGLLMLISAGYTKQLAATSAIAILIWMFIRNPRRAILWGMGFVLVGMLIFLYLNIATDGQWWIQTIVANVNEFKPLQAFGLFALWFQLHGFLLIPAILYFIYELYFERLSLYSIWFIVSTILGGIGSGTWGAGDSYFATSIAGMCILSGIFFSRLLGGKWDLPTNYFSKALHRINIGRLPFIPTVFLIIPLLYIGYARAVWHMPTQGFIFEQISSIANIQPNIRDNFFDSASFDVEGYANIGYLVTEDDIEAGYTIVELMKAESQPVMSEEAGFSLVASRDVITNPTQLLNLSRASQYDGEALLSMIRQQEFGLIILRAQFYPTPVLEAIGQYYSIDRIIEMNRFEYQILRPNTD